jgi:hypothetical protein
MKIITKMFENYTLGCKSIYILYASIPQKKNQRGQDLQK